MADRLVLPLVAAPVLVGALAIARAPAPEGELRAELVHRFEGKSPDEPFGVAVAGGGDVDADGTPDLAVGAYDPAKQLPYHALAGKEGPEPGRVTVFSGEDGTVLLELRAESADFAFGTALAIAGDVDADGHADVLVGSPLFSFGALLASSLGGKSWTGRALVYSGASGEVLATLEDARAGSTFGWSVAGLGDLDGDGHADVAVGSAALGGDGSAIVYSGKEWRVLHRIASVGQGMDGEAGALGDFAPADPRSASVVAAAGDVDADGTPDLVVGFPQAGEPERGTGAARVVSGASGAVLHSWRGPARFSAFGSSAAGLGDLDGDGHADVLVGAPGWDAVASHAGGAFVHSGRTGEELFVIEAPGEHAGGFGASACSLGDLTGDGIPDFAIAARGEGSAPFVPGRARVYSGATGELLADVPGQVVCSAGDLDGDGRAELFSAVERARGAGNEPQPGTAHAHSFADSAVPGSGER